MPAVRQFEHLHNNVEFLQIVDEFIRLYKRLQKASKNTQDIEEEDEETSKLSCYFVLCSLLITPECR